MSSEEEDIALSDHSSDGFASPVEEVNEEILLGDFLLVKFAGKKTITYYIGKVVGVDCDLVTTKFMRRSTQYKQVTFTFPALEDIAEHPKEDIVQKLPQPISLGGTKRTAAVYRFPVNLEEYEHV